MITITVDKNEEFNLEDISFSQFSICIEGLNDSYSQYYKNISVIKRHGFIFVKFNYNIQSNIESIMKRAYTRMEKSEAKEMLLSFLEIHYNMHPKDKGLSCWCNDETNDIQFIFAYWKISFQKFLKYMNEFWGIIDKLPKNN